jgi:trk system potassium uptake protein TrkH
MIRFRGLLHILGVLSMVLACAMLVPLIYGTLVGAAGIRASFVSFFITAVFGLTLTLCFPRPATDLTIREGILVTVLVWVVLCLFGSLPFYLSPHFTSFTDAVFESTSGFTTTGASILTDVEVLPPDIQLWRHFAHWIGGMGIVLLGIAVLPLIGVGGMALYRAEFSGARSEKLKPRLAETALSLWRIYFALTVVQCLLLRMAGMTAYDAICHAFSTLGTGGFSTRTASVAAFQNPAVEYIITAFMILAGMNFTRHYQLLRHGDVKSFFDFEIRGYLTIIAISTLLVFGSLAFVRPWSAAEETFRLALFQVASIVTTTGFASTDYEQWPPFCHALLLILMFCGGCTGSTAGGWKVARALLLTSQVSREFRRTAQRRGVFALRVAGQVIPEQTIQSLLNLVYLSLLVFIAAVLGLTATSVDLMTAVSGVAAAMFSVGPGFGTVGPAENYAHISVVGKWILTLCMFAGRLEFYTAIVVISPGFWRK